MTDRN